jgi:hypothetical protein
MVAVIEVVSTMRIAPARRNTPENARPRSGEAHPWPLWAQAAMSLALLYHIAATLAGALAVNPSSEVERWAAGLFARYYELVNQGYGHRYYSRLDTTADRHDPRPWATPVVTAEMEFDRPGGGKDAAVVRLPGRPRSTIRLRHQRELDLAFHLASDPRWAASYARHLCKTRGCRRVTIYTQEHRIPDLALVRRAASGSGAPEIDLEAESTYGPRIKLGEFQCTDF